MSRLSPRFRHALRPLLLTLFLLFPLVSGPTPARAQLTDLIELNATAGYDGFFRPHLWMPIRVEVVNNGDAVTGVLTVRPETSSGLTNAFETPVDLPANASQVITLFATARSGARELRVELLDAERRVLASHDTAVRSVAPHDQLYIVVAGTVGGTVIDLSTVRTGGNAAFQGQWTTANIPTNRAALDAVTAIVFNNVDTGVLSPAQRDALTDWVRRGGHLIVAGGPNWQATAAGFTDLLPLVPARAQEGDAMPALARFSADYAAALDGPFVVAEGELTDDATVLVATAGGLPVLARRALGGGTVDYLSVDPDAAPLRGWSERDGLWFTLLTSVGARPNWSYGFADWDTATVAVEIMPGVDLLPAVLGLVAFLTIYVLLVGPLNYLLLSRINRRELAWVSIPVMIVVFTLLARAFGAELRGSDVTVSRLSVVQTWPDSDDAQLDQLIGLLAPRRGTYSLSMDDERLLRPIPAGTGSVGVFAQNAQNNATITQGTAFAAPAFPVDASFIAGFAATGELPRPAISGSVVLSYPPADAVEPAADTDEDPHPARQTLQGSVRNDSSVTLTDPVILARGTLLRLDGDLEPGGVRAFAAERLPLPGDSVPAPAPIEYAVGEDVLDYFTGTTFATARSSYALLASRTARDILGPDYESRGVVITQQDDPELLEARRRQALLQSFIIDQYASTARGDDVYLIGWADNAPVDQRLEGATWNPVDTTLYIIKLEVERGPLPGGDVRIAGDQFTWVTTEREGVSAVGPAEFQLFSEDAITYRFTPLPGAVLAEVSEIVFVLELATSGNVTLPVDFWHWEAGTWVTLGIRDVRTPLPDAERFIGPNNAVSVRITRPQFGGTTSIDRITIEQVGSF